MLRVPPTDTSFVPFTTSAGGRFFLRCNEANSDPSSSSSSSSSSLSPQTEGGLYAGGIDSYLSQPIDALMAAYHKKHDKKMEARAAMTTASVASSSSSTSSSSSSSSSAKRVAVAGRLWVDKYAPVKFSELLSPEKTNRQVLRWIKTWDPMVFGRAGPKAIVDPTQYRSYAQLQQDATAALGGGPVARIPPETKVILLCGPPGLGKTTLAHIVARHAGYNSMEINASDDRSKDKLTQRILDAMQMQSMFGEKKPNCIILDEIDGALGGGEGRSAIGALVKMIKADKTQPKQRRITRPIICICNNLYAPALRPLRSVARVFVMRETTSTRLMARLKTVCRNERLMLRSDALSLLCSRTDNDIRSCLNTLQFLASNGVRTLSRDAVVNTCVGHKDRKVAMFDVWRAIFTVPKRDHQAGAATSRGGNSFQKKGQYFEQRRSRGQNEDSMRQKKRRDLGADKVMSVTSRLGRDMGRILDGIHSNFATQSFNDPMLTKTAAVLDWLCFSDMCNFVVHTKQQWKLMAYPSSACAAVHMLTRSQVSPQITYPRARGEMTRGRKVKLGVLQGFRNGLVASGAPACGPSTILRDVVSPFLDISAPRLRPISRSLMSPWEKKQVDDLVLMLAKQRITFLPQQQSLRFGGSSSSGGAGAAAGGLAGGENAQQGQNNTSSWRYGGAGRARLEMDPPIKSLVDFSDLPYQKCHNVLPADVVRTIKHEIELAKMRSDHVAQSDPSPSQASPSKASPSKASLTSKKRKDSEESSKTPSSSLPSKKKMKTPGTAGSHRGPVKDHTKLIEADSKKVLGAARDFFGRPVASKKRKGMGMAKKAAKEAAAVAGNSANANKKQCVGGGEGEEENIRNEQMTLFKFTPGFTNAV